MLNDYAASLLTSSEPAIQYKLRAHVLAEEPETPAMVALRQAVKNSARVRTMLADRDPDGRLRPLQHVYQKWRGAHWVLAALADIGYPPGEPDLAPLLDQVLATWLDPEGIREHWIDGVPPARRGSGVPIIQGRARRCASQQGNALFAASTLGLLDARTRRLADLLIRWQWPDGGWNCDRKPDAATSSFWESLLPLRGLACYAKATGDREAHAAASRAAEFFLARRLFRRQTDGSVINPQFLRLHYPCYWRYDILFALKVMAEAGFIGDERCTEALDLVEAKRLPDGGWPAEERFYRLAVTNGSGCDLVDWGGVNRRTGNPWVTVDALAVLVAAGRLQFA